MKKILTVEFENKISEISRLGEICDGFADQYSLSPEIANAIGLSLDEILTNIISYGYDDTTCHKITVDFFISDVIFKAVITDDGRKFNPVDQPEADLSLPLEEKNIGGLGLHLVRNLMDQIEYEYDNGKNILTIMKELGSKEKIVEISIDKLEDIQIFKISGKLDSYTSGDFEKQLLNTIENGNKKIIMDLSELDYISSAGLRTLLLAAKKLKPAGGKIVLSCLKEHIKQVFQIAGFTAIFPIYSSVDDATGDF